MADDARSVRRHASNLDEFHTRERGGVSVSKTRHFAAHAEAPAQWNFVVALKFGALSEKLGVLEALREGVGTKKALESAHARRCLRFLCV